MNESQETKMRANLAEYSKGDFADLAVNLQSTIDNHVSEQRARQTAVTLVARQNEALEAENTRLEGLTKGLQQVDNDEVIALRARVEELDNINQGLQRTIVKLS
jgi:hypothetical protein